MSLFIYVIEPELRKFFREHLETKHRPTDSGFDILLPRQDVKFNDNCLGQTVHTGIIVAAMTLDGRPAPCLLLPRSSITGTPLRLANSIGLIDMGYRGEVMAKCDCVDPYCKVYEIMECDRRFQLVQHNFLPWKRIHIVDSMHELPPAPDNRGSGGFGSTG